MTPSGVEQETANDLHGDLVNVSKTMTPSGVEQLLHVADGTPPDVSGEQDDDAFGR